MQDIAAAVFANGGELAARMRAHDWRSSALGPVEAWPPALRTLVGVMLGSKQPMFTVWGPERTLLYNDAYCAILGHKDRDALGRDFLEVWEEIRADLTPLIERSYAGEATHMDDITLVMDREGRDPEAHFAFSYTPVRDEDGSVAGFFCACSETTDSVMVARRQSFRLGIEETLRHIEDADTVMNAAGEALGRHLKADRVGYAEVEADTATVTIHTTFAIGVAPLGGSYPLEVFGRSAQDTLRGGNTVVVTDTRDLANTDPALWATIETGAYVSVPITRAGRLAATLFVDQAAPRRWSVEDVALIEATATRVSEVVHRLRAEQDARASEARFRSLTQALPNQVWTATPDGTIDWVNERTLDYLGQDEKSLLEAGWLSVIHPDDQSVAIARWGAALASGDVYEVEFRIRKGDDSWRWHLARAVAERTFAGAITRWVGTNTDIDDQKRAELNLSAAKAEAEEANLAKSTFIANMSHELRTPLSAIIGYSEMMAEEIADGCEPADLGPDMAKVEGNARHLLGLINDVLDLSKIESGKMEVYVETFEVEPVLRELAATVKGLVDKKRNALRVDLAPGLGRASTDVTKLRQMLLNLLGNAAKFTEDGTIALEASRQTGPDGRDRLVLVVRDSGIGMTPEQLSRLFQRFTQADSSTTRRFGGSGLGLSLVKAFADMLDGQVTVTSGSGDGSAFTLTLPAVLEQDTAVLADPEPAATEIGAAQDLVLVIDDDVDQRTLMTRFLHRERFRVQVAADGRTGLALARRLHPRAILLDVMMPGIDGWSVLSELKADPDLKDTPVIMVTSVDQRSLATSLGASDYMLKPVRWDRFSTTMNRFRTPQGEILLIDDDVTIRMDTRAMLERDGWTVSEAGNGREALELARGQRPDAVLLDLNMPVMDGFDFLAEFRDLPGCAEVPVVVLTARDLDRGDRGRLRGASQILNKGDIGMRGLVERLHRLADSSAAPVSGVGN